MNPYYEKLTFEKRINKMKIKKKSNSSFNGHHIYHSFNNTLINSERGRKKSLNSSYLTQLNGTYMQDFNFFIPSKNKSLNISENCNSTFRARKKHNNKMLLYEDSLKLKAKINKLNKEIALAKSEIRKKDEEIRKREKAIDLAKIRLKKKKPDENLKEENIIIKLKDNYQHLKSKLDKQVDENNKLFNEIKKINLNEIEESNETDTIMLKRKIKEYYNSLQFNINYSSELNLYTFNKKEFINNHSNIVKMTKKVDEKKEKINLLKINLKLMKDKLQLIEESRKRIILYNDCIKKQNEKLLLDKKKREDYILKKPILLGKINALEVKSKNFEDNYKNNEHEIQNMALEKQKISKRMISSAISRPIDYDKLTCIEKNPKDKMDQRIILLQSLIKESQDKQNQFIEIFTYYDNYIKQKEYYEKLEEKIIGERIINKLNKNKNKKIDVSPEKKN